MLALFTLFFAVVAFVDANTIPIEEEPCIGRPVVMCFVDPCQVSSGCPAHPDAVCHANYCGGCNDYYYDAKSAKRVNCTLSAKIEGVCPPTNDGLGLCAEMCNDCEAKGQLCCSNGCGHECMDPVKPKPLEGVCPKPTGFGLCAQMCDNCEAKGQLCCSNGCGNECMAPVTLSCPEAQGFGICVEMCDNCEAMGQMCCSNGCGHECMDPIEK